MERVLFRSLLLIFFLSCLCLFSSAQDITGIWKGYFITNDGEQYKLEFQVKQNNTLSVTGVSYSYLDVRFYGKATMTGSINKSEKKFQIQELRTVEVKSVSGNETCLMKYIFTYDKSGREEFLEGTFVGRSEDRKNPKNDGEWGNCGGGTVYLRKVQNSDFYVEPFLRDKPKPNTITAKPRTNELVVKSPPVVKKNIPKTNPVAKSGTNPIKKSIIKKPNSIPVTDTTKKITIAPVIKKTLTDKKIFTPEILKTRENELARTITVNTEEVTIRLYDNGEIDDDTISVFVDKQLMLSHKRLSATAITLTLKFNADNKEHEVVMVAENLGRIPPNTSLMVITAGDKRYQVQITSTEQKNALVRFKYEEPLP
jgi:hypothetical protein